MQMGGKTDEQRRQDQIDTGLRRARRAAHDAARHALTCPNCGNPDGLLGWSPEGVLAAIEEAKYPLPKFYIAAGYDPERLYTRCLTCQAASAEVLARCTLLTAAQLAAWVKDEECRCFLPESTCPVCELAAKIERDWDDQIPF